MKIDLKKKHNETEKNPHKCNSILKRKIILITIGTIVMILLGTGIIIFIASTRNRWGRRIQMEDGATSGATTSEAPFSEVCQTEECVKLGATMRSYMNLSANPCEDFFEYSCGNYSDDEFEDGEIFKQVEEDTTSLKEILKNYQPVTKSERIAMVFMEKCVKTENDPDLNEDIWKSDDLTELLIEMARVDMIHTGFIENDINIRSYQNQLVLGLILMNGISEYTEMNDESKKILEEHPELLTPNLVDVSTFQNQITFMNLTHYFLNLLPEENHGIQLENWKIQALRNDMFLLEKVVEKMGVAEIKKVLFKKWKETLEGFLVRFGDSYEGCFDQAQELFPGTLAMIFIKKFVKSENVQKSNQLFEDLKVVFNEMLDENTWIDENLKNILRKELEALKSSIGVPDEHKDVSNIDRMYGRIEKEQKVEDQSYLTLVRNILKMNSEETFLRVARRETITFLGETMEFSANFEPLSHRVSLAPIFLNYPYIDQNLPEWNTLATFGSIAGHEIGHTFDAHLFFINQTMLSISMSEEMKNEFEQRISCITKKYDKFEFPDGSFSNGTFTTQEDSADMIGFNLAYRLFKKLDKNQQKLPGFENQTVEQNYFQRIANFWCSKELDQVGIHYQKTDTHSAFKFRVNGMMSNSVDFARAFGCEKGSPMNPEKKCPLFK